MTHAQTVCTRPFFFLSRASLPTREKEGLGTRLHNGIIAIGRQHNGIIAIGRQHNGIIAIGRQHNGNRKVTQ